MWIIIFLIALFYCDSYSTGYETFDWYDADQSSNLKIWSMSYMNILEVSGLFICFLIIR